MKRKRNWWLGLIWLGLCTCKFCSACFLRRYGLYTEFDAGIQKRGGRNEAEVEYFDTQSRSFAETLYDFGSAEVDGDVKLPGVEAEC